MMCANGNTGHRTRIMVTALILFAVLIGLQLLGCNQDPPLEPLPAETPQGTMLAGTVRSEEGHPVPDAVITLEELVDGMTGVVLAQAGLSPGNEDPRQENTTAKSALRTAVTDNTGRYQFHDVDPGWFALGATAGDHLAAARTVLIPEREPLALADTVLVDIALTPVGSFHGNATLENGVDHDGTVVYVDGTSFVAVTDSRGDYSLTGVPTGGWTVKAMHSGYLDGTTSGTIVAAGDSTTLPPLVLLLNSNLAPTALPDSVIPVPLGTPSHFSGTGHDEDGTILLYEWDFENDGLFDFADSNSATTSHTYPAPGSFLAKLRVTDDRGSIGLAVVPVEVMTVFADLVVVSVQIDPPTPEFNEPVQARALVRNIGAINAGISNTRFYLDDTPYCLLPTPALAAGDSVWVAWCDLAVPGDGPHEVKACADIDDVVFEEDEDNNCVSLFYSVTAGIFVDGISGSPAGTGTMLDPVNTVGQGLALAGAQGGPVLVAAGDYFETVTLASGVDIIGGYDPIGGWTWDPNANPTTIHGGTRAVIGQEVSDIDLIGLRIVSETATAPGASSYGLYLTDSQQILVQYCTITAGHGAPGNHGQPGQDGAGGNPGLIGSPGCEDSSFSCSACDRPPAGLGGSSSWGSAGGQGGLPGHGDARGSDGQPGLGPASAPGGLGGGGDGLPGTDGPYGNTGVHGSGGSAFGSLTEGGYLPTDGASGTGGQYGTGGGGGGGGGGGDNGCNSYGSSGGGGGSGGEPGTNGTGGSGAGGSFPVWVFGVSNILIDECELIAGTGGNGGDGGNGGSGGLGGPGGQGGPYGGINEQDDGGMGAEGGRGGDGGTGGSGGGGGGGPSIGIVADQEATVVHQSIIFTLGFGGYGGSSDGNSGQNGFVANIHTTGVKQASRKQ